MSAIDPSAKPFLSSSRVTTSTIVSLQNRDIHVRKIIDFADNTSSMPEF
jgi:hypothetical protein